ncbi:DUF676-domain-containing protein [Hanseniaspora valbyensis NRRL Y-1626]|uniref:DUF676-domain-containing protein n=1 Tax=Hanseniaspora valbyensis NRRL Y-1626 TaxID=766949 RepID=A0A1B7TDC2_9ASCO|nr:DUF676-domain-containing protein [Hanseniaspora valbyensis NRRL Y-1626]
MNDSLHNKSPESLFILMHGLLGSHKHMHAVRDLILSKDESNSLVLIPCKNGFFKTFDGIEIVGDRVIKEIKIFLKTRSESEIKSLKWISFISYSMGGLISRYVIGEILPYLEKRYPNIKLNTFMTFATPHLGVNFFKDGKFPYNVLTTLGSNLLGRSGRQLFLEDKDEKNSEKLMLKISKGKYLDALKKFKYRICLANAHNDRTVAYYTAFITDSGYTCDLNTFEEDCILCDWSKFPKESILNVTKDPSNCENEIQSNKEKKLKIRIFHGLKFMGKVFAITLFVFCIFPLVLVINTVGTTISYINVWFYKNKMTLLSKFSYLNKNWLSKKLDIDLDEEFDDDEMEQLIEVLSRDDTEDDSIKDDMEDLLSADWELKKNKYIDTIESVPTDKRDSVCFKYFIEKYNKNNIKQHFEDPNKKLPFDAVRKEMYENLNKLKWIRVPYKLTGANTHRAIVARSGIESTSFVNRKALDFNIELLIEVSKYANEGIQI